jgi:phosphoglycolate phosphatase
MAIELLVFDLDGTLVDSAADLRTAVNAALQEAAPGAAMLSEAEVRSFIGSGARMLIERSLVAAGATRTAEDVLPLFLEAYRGCLLDETRPYPGVLEALEELRPRRFAVLTNKPGDMARTLLRGLGIAGRFLRIAGGGDFPKHKPDPAGLLQILSEAGATPQQSAMVGDSGVDVATGRAAGVFTVGVSYGFDLATLRTTPPDLMIDDLRSLAGHL